LSFSKKLRNYLQTHNLRFQKSYRKNKSYQSVTARKATK